MKNSLVALSTGRRLPRTVALLLLLLFLFQPILRGAAVAQRQSQKQRQSQPKASQRMNENQRMAHVLSRLTFGARPGDPDRIRALGVDAYIAQQLDPDAIDDTALLTKLGKLPTLALATPVLIEQYTPPKVVPAPLPTTAPSPTQPAKSLSAMSDGAAEPRTQVPLLESSSKPDQNVKMEPPQWAGAMKEEKPGADEMKKLAEAGAKNPDTNAKQLPKPPEKNPQRVVTELQRAALLRAVYSERQLYEVMVNFWENHFSIFAYKDADRLLLTGFDRETIRPFALGRFRDLLGATAHSPAMLFYLDNWRSSVVRPYPATKDKPAGSDGGLNENYARELMELHTMGVDGGYTQKDVQEVARCFTGWTIQKPTEEGLFLYRPGLHDNGEKVVLGHKIHAGGGISDGERVLDMLASNPSTARFIATKLARRFIADDPPVSVIDRAAAAFLKTDGSIRETLRAIITAPEFFSPAAYRAKVRTPFEYVVAALRVLNAETDVDPAVPDWTKRMGQQVFGRVTPDGYPDRSDQWLSAGSMLERLNFASALARNRIKGTHFDAASLFASGNSNDPQTTADRLMNALLTSDVSQQTRQALAKTLKQSPTLCAPNTNVKSINYLVEQNKGNGPTDPPCAAEVVMMITMLIGSPEFQRR